MNTDANVKQKNRKTTEITHFNKTLTFIKK